MENPIHVQLRAAREAHGLTQHELAARAGVGRSDIQRLERGANVGIRLLEKVLAQLPGLTTFQMGGIEVTGRITVDVESVRQIILDIVSAGTEALQVLEQARPAAGQVVLAQSEESPREETPAPQPKPPRDGPAGATRYRRKKVVSEELKEHLRRIDPVYQRTIGRDAVAPPPPERDPSPGDES